MSNKPVDTSNEEVKEEVTLTTEPTHEPEFVPESVEVKEEEAPVVARLSTTVTMDKPIMEKNKSKTEYPIFTLRTTIDEFNEASTKYPQFKMQGDKDSRSWLEALRQGLTMTLQGNAIIDVFKRDKAEWRQNVDYEGIKLAIGKPPVTAGDGQKVTGQTAIMKIQNQLGLGTMVQIPAWHSGIWVTMRTPTDAALLNLERRIAEEKIALGRETNGLIYSNAMVYIVNHLFNFIIEHVYDATIKEYTPDKLRSLLRVTDLPILVWGLACSIYPNGYTHSQPCTIAPDKCQFVTKEHLNLTKICWVDNSALTRFQKRHMANRVTKYDVSEITKYQHEGSGGDGKVIDIKDGVRFALRVPTVEQYVETGYQWVQEIVSMVDNAFSDNLSDTKKNELMIQHSNLVALRKYSHWIKHVIDADDAVIDDVDNINELMDLMSSSDEVVEAFLNGVKAFMEEGTLATIALPSYKCPNCQGTVSAEETKHPYLIPIEVNMLFFTLRDRRLMRVKTN